MALSRGEFGLRMKDSAGSVGRSTDEQRDHQPFAHPAQTPAEEYAKLGNQIAANIVQINSNIASVTRMSNQLGTVKDTTQLRSQLSTVQHSNTTLIKATNESIHRLERFTSSSTTQQHQRALQQERLRKNFKVSVGKFHAVENLVVQKQKEAISLARQSVSLTSGGLEEDDDPGAEDQRLLDARREQLQQQEQEDAATLQVVREREEALRQLESDVLDVNQIFRDLGEMVHEQGSAIDTIENNVEMAAIDVEAAGQEITVAARYQKKVRNKKCFLLISFLVVAGVLALIIVLANQ